MNYIHSGARRGDYADTDCGSPGYVEQVEREEQDESKEGKEKEVEERNRRKFVRRDKSNRKVPVKKNKQTNKQDIPNQILNIIKEKLNELIITMKILNFYSVFELTRSI